VILLGNVRGAFGQREEDFEFSDCLFVNKVSWRVGERLGLGIDKQTMGTCETGGCPFRTPFSRLFGLYSLRSGATLRPLSPCPGFAASKAASRSNAARLIFVVDLVYAGLLVHAMQSGRAANTHASIVSRIKH
jgi:hypothetical protein